MKEANNNIPQHWEMKKLNDVVSVLGDGLHGTPKYADNGDYFFINGNNLCDGKIVIKENTKRVSKEEYEKYKKPLNQNTILVSINGTLGNIAFYNNEKVILGKSACYFNVLETINKNYLRILLSGLYFLNYASNTATGSTIQNVSLKAMREFELPLPPLPEQIAIVNKIEELFSELENGKEQLLTAQRQLKIYRQSLLKAAFEGRLTNENVKDGELPDGWKWVKNQDILKYVTSGSRDWKKYYSNEGSRFVRTQDINSNKLYIEKTAFVSLPEKVEGKRSLIEQGDILMTITGANVGKVAVVDFPIENAYVSQSVALLKYHDNKNTKFLWYFFQAPGFGKTQIEKMVYGVGRPVLSLENMRDVNVIDCSLKEQQAIVEILESKLTVCDKLEETISHSLEQTETLRQSILKKAFEGKLYVD